MERKSETERRAGKAKASYAAINDFSSCTAHLFPPAPQKSYGGEGLERMGNTRRPPSMEPDPIPMFSERLPASDGESRSIGGCNSEGHLTGVDDGSVLEDRWLGLFWRVRENNLEELQLKVGLLERSGRTNGAARKFRAKASSSRCLSRRSTHR